MVIPAALVLSTLVIARTIDRSPTPQVLHVFVEEILMIRSMPPHKDVATGLPCA